MELNIRIADLIKLLCKAEDISDQYRSESRILQEYSSGVQYLFKHFLRPIIHESSYSVGNIDLDQFDREELETLWEIYRDKYSPQSDTWRNAEKIYTVCSDAPSQARAVTFI